jgi:membrane protein required for colicin V production
MPFQYLDIALVGIMLISGLLALMRGFTREVLALLTWGGAAVAAYMAYMTPAAHDFVRQFVDHDIGSKAALVGGVFLITLIFLSILTMRLSDWVLDSGVGAIDRTLGFFFGLARGLLIVAVAYMFYIWWVPPEKSPPWVQQARSLPLIDETASVIIQILPPDIGEVLLAKTLSERRKAGTLGNPVQNQNNGSPATDSQAEEGYKTDERQDLNQVIQAQ